MFLLNLPACFGECCFYNFLEAFLMAENTNEKTESVAQPEVVWNDSNMKSLYVNATNVLGGREELMILLGLNQAWNNKQEKVQVDIAERVVMTPYTAKRLAIMLAATLKAYEAKFGQIDIGLQKKD